MLRHLECRCLHQCGGGNLVKAAHIILSDMSVLPVGQNVAVCFSRSRQHTCGMALMKLCIALVVRVSIRALQTAQA